MTLASLLFGFNGRITRKQYWLTSLALFAVTIVLILVVVAIVVFVAVKMNFQADTIGPQKARLIKFICAIPGIWIYGALGAKRLHDRGKTAQWMWLFCAVTAISYVFEEKIVLIIATLIQIWAWIEIAILPGQKCDNEYGPNPYEPGRVRLDRLDLG